VHCCYYCHSTRTLQHCSSESSSYVHMSDACLPELGSSLALGNKYMSAETIEVCRLRIELEPTAYRPVCYNHGAMPHLSPLNVIMYFLLNLSFLKSYWTRRLINSREKPYIFITAFGQLSFTSAEAVWKILTNFLISKKWCNRIGFEYRTWAKSFLQNV
jgi:hypothetical protein